jgi:hypothetical protein
VDVCVNGLQELATVGGLLPYHADFTIFGAHCIEGECTADPASSSCGDLDAINTACPLHAKGARRRGRRNHFSAGRSVWYCKSLLRKKGAMQGRK